MKFYKNNAFWIVVLPTAFVLVLMFTAWLFRVVP